MRVSWNLLSQHLCCCVKLSDLFGQIEDVNKDISDPEMLVFEIVSPSGEISLFKGKPDKVHSVNCFKKTLSNNLKEDYVSAIILLATGEITEVTKRPWRKERVRVLIDETVDFVTSPSY